MCDKRKPHVSLFSTSLFYRENLEFLCSGIVSESTSSSFPTIWTSKYNRRVYTGTIDLTRKSCANRCLTGLAGRPFHVTEKPKRFIYIYFEMETDSGDVVQFCWKEKRPQAITARCVELELVNNISFQTYEKMRILSCISRDETDGIQQADGRRAETDLCVFHLYRIKTWPIHHFLIQVYCMNASIFQLSAIFFFVFY